MIFLCIREMLNNTVTFHVRIIHREFLVKLEEITAHKYIPNLLKCRTRFFP
jgi:hypothetical protein